MKTYDYKAINLKNIHLNNGKNCLIDNEKVEIISPIVEISQMNQMYLKLKCTQNFHRFIENLIERISYILWKTSRISYYTRIELIDNSRTFETILMIFAYPFIRKLPNKSSCKVVFEPYIFGNDVFFIAKKIYST